MAFAADFPAEQLEFFEKNVRPVLVEHCYSCHSVKAEKIQADLLLDSRSAILRGGDSGPAIVAGKPAESLLIAAVRYESYEMPPRGKLSVDEIAALEKWVRIGAPWPDEAAPRRVNTRRRMDLQQMKAAHWSWHPIVRPDPPPVRQVSWPRHPIDRFVLAELEKRDLAPTAPADRRTWIRRVYFDLIGLPPEADEVQAFVDDRSSDAFEKVVDQLLDSKRFGEKWARHWMDLVRYAETHGHEFDYPIHHAFRYRDYLIRALNADVPYDQFVKEHIAGDLLRNPRLHPTEGFNESVIGTGFWFLGEAVHSPTDVRGDEVIRIDNQIDVMTKTFLGLTVACARCHDHKFDPIGTDDYYALTGFLQSSRRQEAMLDPHGKIRELATRIRQLRTDGDRQLHARLSQLSAEEFSTYLLAANEAKSGAEAIDRFAVQQGLDTVKLKRWVRAIDDPGIHAATHPLTVWSRLRIASDDSFVASRRDLAKTFNAQLARATENRAAGVVFEDFNRGDWGQWRATGEAFEHVPGDSIRWNAETEGSGVVLPGVAHSGHASRKLRGVLRSPTFKLEHPNLHYRINGEGVRIRLIIDGYFMDVFNGLLFRGVTMNNVNTDGSFQWVTQGGDIRNHLGRTAHIEIIDNGDGFAAVDEIRFSQGGRPMERPNDIAMRIATDESVKTVAELAARLGTAWGDCVSAARNADPSVAGGALLDWAVRHELVGDPPVVDTKLVDQIARLGKQIPTPIYALAITDGSGEEGRIHIRGDHENLGEAVPRRLLTAIAGENQPPIEQGSGRLELAERMIDQDNPFISRVIVNRIWHHLFGHGIVPSVDDFGVMGQPPSHPELLDWLAADFMEHGWSIKRTIRMLALTSTYRMDSRCNDETTASTVDPTNRLLHHFPIRRLQAEAIRDAMLKISGRLDTQMFGPSVPVHLTAFMEGRGRPGSGPLDGNGRRSIYVAIRRNFLSPMMLSFDMPSPFSTMGRRSESNVPAQSLILMNDPLVVQQAKVWARRVVADYPDEEERITAMFNAAFARPPTAGQREQSKQFLRRQAELYATDRDDIRVWADLGHMLFNMKAFVFLR